MAKLRVVIVDDEAPARERLARLLGVHADVTIAGEAADVEAAADLCRRVSPHIVILDVQLRAACGFDLLPLLTGRPAVIVVSAYHEYAEQTAAVNAVAFLPKPIHPDRLATALADAALRCRESAGNV